MNQSVYRVDLAAPEMESVPRRVVSLVPSVTESMFELMLGDRLIARTAYCIFPEGQVESLPTIGGTKNPDIQRIIDLKPDLVIANQEENRKEDVEALRASGITVWVTFPRTVPDVFNLLWDLMNLLGNTSMVPRVRLIEQTYDWVLGITKTNEDRPVKVFVPIWLDPLMTFNHDTYLHDLLRVCGGTNVFAERERQIPLQADLGQGQPYPDDDARAAGRDRRYPRVTWDEVIDKQPDVILLPSEPFQFTQEHLPLFTRLDVPAAHHQRIYLVDGSYLTWHGTRIARALDSLPALLTPTGDL